MKKTAYLLLFGYVLVFVSCKSDSDNLLSAKDTTPPTVILTKPVNNTIVTDSVLVTVDASDDVGVQKVEFYVDGGLVYTRAFAPWQYNWVVLQLPDKSTHAISAKGYDAANNIGSSTLVTVQVTRTAPPLDFSEYGELLDSLYFKVWSDSSWAKYRASTAISGTQYLILESSTGTWYYFSSAGYAGFKMKGESLIMFDHPVTRLPVQWHIGDSHPTGTTFTYQGYVYTMTNSYTLVDTTSVSVPFGVFSRCLHFSTTIHLSAGGQSSTASEQFWTARGPGSIRNTNQQGLTTLMVRGYVNGRYWAAPQGRLLTLSAIDNSTKRFGKTMLEAFNLKSISTMGLRRLSK